MELIELYRIWAPQNVLWSQWVKPVLFACELRTMLNDMDIPEIGGAPNAKRETMIIVDTPGQSSVIEGLALARLGYRPVPLYNGVCGPGLSKSVVDTIDIVAALRSGAQQLGGMPIDGGAPPAFLLDSNRMNGFGKMPGTYDNRWSVFPQDMPSADFLLGHGIQSVIVRSDQIREDLSHILLRYQERGIVVYLYNGHETNLTLVKKPSRFKSLAYRFLAVTGLIRNPAGGFGGQLRDEDYHYHGVG